MIHRESWYKEASLGQRIEEVAHQIIHIPEEGAESLWRELYLLVGRGGPIPESLIKSPHLYPKLVLDLALPLLTEGLLGSLPEPLHEYALHQADIEDENVQVYLRKAVESLSEDGKVEELEALESRVDELSEEINEKGIYDECIFLARLISWEIPWGTADDILKKFSNELHYHAGSEGLRAFVSRWSLVEASEFDYGHITVDWAQESSDYTLEGDVTGWKDQHTDSIDVWSDFAHHSEEFPHRDFWIALHEADTDGEVREAMEAAG